ncbi:hypothetical protein A6U98_25180 [Rhizobium sp. WYCCWR10014]|nr:hypothetical protein A6U98_25180 [Rhizobium sp. WYCCWR10014]
MKRLSCESVIGALGSTRTHRRRVERLTAMGFKRDDVGRIKAPIGMFGPTRDASSLACRFWLMSLRQDWWPMRKASVAIVILAAGKASRMGEGGKHKLLAEFDGVPLVRRSALTALGANAASVTVVVGHRRSEIEAALSARPTSLLRPICPCSMSMSAMQLASTSIRRTISWPPAAG